MTAQGEGYKSLVIFKKLRIRMSNSQQTFHSKLFFFFRATIAAYGSSQPRGQICATAGSLTH